MVLLNELLSDGLYLFPLKANGKTPIVKDWDEVSSNDADVIAKWAEEHPRCNWGVDVGKSGLFVIDVDTHKGKNGLENISAVLTDKERNTFTVETPSGGLHLYYDGVGRNSANKLADGVDTRGQGGYVVAYGSTIDGKKYKVVKDLPFRKPPVHVLEELDKARESRETNNAVELDTPETISRSTLYLATEAEPAIEGQGGDALTYQVACRVRDFGLSEEMALELMLRYYNPRCVPSWDEGELEVKVRNAYTYAANDAGCENAEAIFSPVVNEQFRFKRACDIDITGIRRREWVMFGRYVRRVMTVTVAEGGAGKSTLALLEMLAIATGRNLTGYNVLEQTNVMYWNNEDDMEEIDRRLAAAIIHYGLPLEDLNKLYLKSGRDFESGEEKFVLVRRDRSQRAVVDQKAVNTLIQFIEVNKIGVVCIDPFVDIHECNENDNMEMNLVTKTLAMIADATNCSISIVHHVNKPAGGKQGWINNSAQSSRGASSVIDTARVGHALLTMPEEMAKNYGIPAEEHWRYVTLNSGKLNLSARNTNLIWLRKVGVKLPNGEEVGTLELAEIEVIEVDPCVEIMRGLRDSIEPGEAVTIRRLTGRLLDSDHITFSQSEQAVARKLKSLVERGFEDVNAERSYHIEMRKDQSANNRNTEHVICAAIKV